MPLEQLARPVLKRASSALEQLLRDSKIRDSTGDLMRVFRGEHTTDPDQFNTYLSAPTFSESPYIAGDYAADATQGRVTANYLDITNPLNLGEAEDVLTYSELQRLLQPRDKEETELMRDIVAKARNWRGWDGSPMDSPIASRMHQPVTMDELDEVLAGNTPGMSNWSRVEPYTDTFNITDNPSFIDLASRRGYDGTLHNGNFVATDDMNVIPSNIANRLESDGAMEYKPFRLDQIHPAPISGATR